MEESSVYQTILNRGEEKGRNEGVREDRIDEARQTFLRMGRRKWGAPSAEIVAAFQAISEVERLESLQDLVWDHAWSELFPPPTAG